jgi:hypothetical protein
MSDKLNLEIIYRLFTDLAPIDFPKAFIILTNSYVPLNLINHILTANKQSPFLKDKCVKAIRGD